jgi:hypothetical protein
MQPTLSEHVMASVEAILDSTYRLYEDGAELVTQGPLVRAVPIAHGWYTAVRRFGRGALLLSGAGLGHEAAPLRRSMIEHALALHWLAANPGDALASLGRASQHTVSRMRRKMDGRWNVPDEVFDSIEASRFDPSSQDRNLHFGTLASEMGQADLHVAWMHESSYCHPSLSGAQFYAEVSGDGSLQLLHEAPHVGDVRAEVAVILLVASDGFSRFVQGPDWSQELKKLTDELRVAISAA